MESFPVKFPTASPHTAAPIFIISISRIITQPVMKRARKLCTGMLGAITISNSRSFVVPLDFPFNKRLPLYHCCVSARRFLEINFLF